jgi:glutaminyl-tRNA synthetase
MAVLEPLKLVITNWDALHGAGTLDVCSAPINPRDPESGKREFKFGKELWIEKTDYEETPPKGYNRLFPGNKVRLKYGHVITWVGAADAVEAEVRLYDRLFAVAQPDTTDKDFLEEINPDSLKVVTAYVEPGLGKAKADDRFQFERHGYFVADRKDHLNGVEGKPVFNRITGMKDSWGK